MREPPSLSHFIAELSSPGDVAGMVGRGRYRASLRAIYGLQLNKLGARSMQALDYLLTAQLGRLTRPRDIYSMERGH